MYVRHSASGPEATVTCNRETLSGIFLKIRSPELPVSRRMLLIVWQFKVPGVQTVTLTVGLFGYNGSLTVMARTFEAEPLLTGLVEDVFDPPPPPQPVINIIDRRRESILLDFIDAHSGGD
jgi:hypothetical protein